MKMAKLCRPLWLLVVAMVVVLMIAGDVNASAKKYPPSPMKSTQTNDGSSSSETEFFTPDSASSSSKSSPSRVKSKQANDGADVSVSSETDFFTPDSVSSSSSASPSPMKSNQANDVSASSETKFFTPNSSSSSSNDESGNLVSSITSKHDYSKDLGLKVSPLLSGIPSSRFVENFPSPNHGNQFQTPPDYREQASSPDYSIFQKILQSSIPKPAETETKMENQKKKRAPLKDTWSQHSFSRVSNDEGCKQKGLWGVTAKQSSRAYQHMCIGGLEEQMSAIRIKFRQKPARISAIRDFLETSILCSKSSTWLGPRPCLNMDSILEYFTTNPSEFRKMTTWNEFEENLKNRDMPLKACIIPQPHKSAGRYNVVNKDDPCPDPFSLS